MVPWPSSKRPQSRRFPRPRGDGPGQLGNDNDFYMVPPPTRGWSRLCWGGSAALLGSPAHAGMVPFLTACQVSEVRFPRPRGDGPSSSQRSSVVSLVPPPTRGWSLNGAQSGRALEGSPAHAGMVPRCFMCRLREMWFPRPRGDGPEDEAKWLEATMVPPPTRGWSPRPRARPARAAGSPAHAGMVPPHAASYRSERRFPRPRGDGPLRNARRNISV